MQYKTQLEEWQDERSTHLGSVEFWLSTVELRYELRDASRYQRVMHNLDEAGRLHALIRPLERYPNDKIIPRLRKRLGWHRPAEDKGGACITDSDLKAAGLKPDPPRTRRQTTRTRPFTAPPAKRQWLVGLWGEGCLIPGRSVRMSRPAGTRARV